MKLFYSLLFLLFTLSVHAQVHPSYYFHNLNINNGLSQNTVNTILQDRNGFMWFGTKDGLNRYDGISFKVFKDRSDTPSGLKQAFITTLFEDSKGYIWIGTDVGVYIYDPCTEHFEHFAVKAQNGKAIDKTVNKISSAGKDNIFLVVDGYGLFVYDTGRQKLLNYAFPNKETVRDVQIDRRGIVWISFYKGLYFTDDNFKTLKPYTLRNGEEPFKEESITAIYFGPSNKMYIGSEKNGMRELDLLTQTNNRLALSDNPATPIFVRCLAPYSNEELWIGTETGIYIYHFKTRTSIHLQNDKSDPFSISDNAIYSLCKDREGGMWIGSYFGGVNYYPKQTTYFEKYYPTSNTKTLQGQRVREIVQGKGDDLWIGTEDAGLFRFNMATKTFKHVEASLGFSNIHGLCMDGDDLWVGTFSKGVHVINTVTGHIKSYAADDKPSTIQDNYVFSILKSSKGHIYLGTSLSLIKYDKTSGRFERIPELDHNLVYDIKEDTQGNLWVATYANGVFRKEYKSGKWEHFRHSDKKGSLPYDKVLSIFEDSRGQVWLTTQGKGFCRFDPASKTFVQYPTSGALHGVVYQIIEDDAGFFWLTTNNGLIRFRPSDGSTKTFTAASGLLNDQFNYKSSYKTADGHILLGCITGLISFNPNTFAENSYIPPVYITDFLLFSKPATVGGKDSPLHKSILFSDTIILKHDQNHFSLRIAALSYQAPQINPLQYKLEGIGEDWQNVTESSLISYSNLRSGKYLFRVRGANNDQLWNPVEKTLFIEILPPFYLTVWAYLVYAIIVLTILFLSLRFFRNRHRLQQKLFVQELEQNKEREIHDAKIRFFTNITHEIRTPLTLIKGPLENIMIKNEINGADTMEDLQIMKQNTDRLLDLTNQLLDFRKTEKEGFLLNLSEYNISSILTDMYQRFSPLIKEYGRAFVLEMDTDNFYAFVDKEAFIKIISNLFSNAIKYADKNIKASLLTKDAADNFEVCVESDGHRISPEHQEDIFKPFTRYNHPEQVGIPGTGIGMYLARTLAELHNGTLRLVHTDTHSNRFSLIIPRYQEQVLVPAEAVEEDFNETHIEIMSNSHTILIVEDSSDMQRFIKRILPEKYNILIASNGEAALELLKNNFVTLVISDIMMPRMTGIELCQKIKSDVNYSHIPVLLLTAKTTLQSKIEGMDVGADAYIEKPFSSEYLLAIIANLINSREKLKEAFMRNPMVMSNSMISTEADKEFLNTLRDVIHRHIHNADLKMEDIAESLNMSRASFYRKIKGLLDMKPNEYLRLERLKMAAHLIRENKYPIGEICYIVGFNSPSYFAKCFQEQFGMLPKDYR